MIGPAALLRQARALIARGQPAAALDLARRAITARPADALVRAAAHQAFSEGIEGFHADMLHDAARNRVLAEAIARLAPGRRVLDIGTGSGLLAMLAARAGAEHVYACEADPRLALTAREIVAANGLADRVTVIAASSQVIEPEDLGGPVDCLVAELFSQDLLGEGMLASVADARARLCRPGAPVVPGRATVRVALAEHGGAQGAIGEVCGLDLAAFNRHVPAQECVRQGRRDLALRSAPADLFAFDFAADCPPEARASLALASTGGRVTGVLQWLRFESAPGLVYENAPAPGAETSHWVLVHHRLPAPIDTAAGAIVPVQGWYGGETLLVWCGE